MGSQLVPEILNSVFSLESVPVEESSVLFGVTMKLVLQRRTLFARIEDSNIRPVLNQFFVLEPGCCPITGGWNF